MNKYFDTISQIVEELIKDKYYSDDVLAKTSNRTELYSFLTDEEKQKIKYKLIPARYEPEWTDYVKSLLTKNELVEDAPTCDGLRRVFKLIIGDIISTEVKVDQVPVISNNNHATVTVTIKYIPRWSSVLHTVSDASDVSDYNIDKPFSNFPVATAVTIAEGRCLRKAIGLIKVNTIEELKSSAPGTVAINEVMANISESTVMQNNVIRSLCKKLNIDFVKLVGKLEGIPKENRELNNPRNLSYEEAQLVIHTLSKYTAGPDNGGEVIPEDLLNNG